jgi:excisionase family DNA binding protein
MERLLTVKDLAGILGVVPGSIYHWLSQGRLPCVRLSKRCVRFRESDVKKMIEGLSFSKSKDRWDISNEFKANQSTKD